jgi:hypothetical protein
MTVSHRRTVSAHANDQDGRDDVNREFRKSTKNVKNAENMLKVVVEG